MKLQAALAALGPLIEQINSICGIAGVSLGVLHEGEIIHYASFGYRDVVAKIPPDENTTYAIASLSKAFASALTGILVDRGDLHWDTPLTHILPDFHRDDRDAACNATIRDLLSHRSGVLGPDALWLLSGGNVAISKDQIVPTFNALPIVKPIRTEFIYSNIGYELIGQAIERVSGTTFGNLLNASILTPLGMKSTFDSLIPRSTTNVAKPYSTLLNRTVHEVEMPLARHDGLFSAAGALRSSVSDLLKFHNALIDAVESPLIEKPRRISDNPLKQVKEQWTGMISLPSPGLMEHSYVLGWARTQLPATFDLDISIPWNPVVGNQSQHKLIIYNQGVTEGFTSFSALIPETRSAIVVLANSGGLAQPGKLIASALLDTLLGGKIDEQNYIRRAEANYQGAASQLTNVMEELERTRQVDAPARPLRAYTGRYHNFIKNYLIDIIAETNPDSLSISFMGKSRDTFQLSPYDNDKFFWRLTHDECVLRGRPRGFPKEYYIVNFAFPKGNGAAVEDPILYWKLDPDYPGEGVPFRRATPEYMYGLRLNDDRSGWEGSRP